MCTTSPEPCRPPTKDERSPLCLRKSALRETKTLVITTVNQDKKAKYATSSKLSEMTI